MTKEWNLSERRKALSKLLINIRLSEEVREMILTVVEEQDKEFIRRCERKKFKYYNDGDWVIKIKDLLKLCGANLK